MSQHIPHITSKDIERVVRRDFSKERINVVMATLNEIGKEGSEEGANRVQMAVLKLSSGDFSKIRHYIEMAKGDFRDVLALAEYPNYMKTINSNSSEEEKKTVIDQDWKQYSDWLNG